MRSSVVFLYDESASKWEILVDGVKDGAEAKDAFMAVVASCQELELELQKQALATSSLVASTVYRILPAVR